jgi:hypothetical protein
MTEAFLSRFPFHRLLQSLAAAALVAAAGFGASTALAGQAEYAGPSTTPLAASAATARPDVGGPRWADLSAAHRKVLAPLSNDWNGLDARSKERWIDVAGRYPKMGPEEQRRTNQRMGEWSRMTVAQRTQARMNFEEARGLSKEEREARWKAYQALPDEKKRELAAKRTPGPASAASASVAAARRHAPPPPLDSVQPKNNLISSSAQARTAAGSAPAGASQRPGVTTTLLNRRAAPPAHQRDGGLKISAGPNSVDRTTLLPKHTTVAAASAGASAPAASRR